jgi:hypothetical protein
LKEKTDFYIGGVCSTVYSASPLKLVVALKDPYSFKEKKMKKFAWFLTLILALSIVLSACGTPAATQAPPPAATEAPATHRSSCCYRSASCD